MGEKGEGESAYGDIEKVREKKRESSIEKEREREF